MLEIDRRAERRLELAPVRLEDRRPRVREEVAVLGIDHHGDATRVRRRHGAPDHGLDQHALVVVLEHECVGIGHRAIDRGEERLHFRSLKVGVDLLVHAHHLLSACDDARLGGGRSCRRDQTTRVGADREQHRTQLRTGRVVTECGDEFGPCAERCGVLRDVRRAAERMLALAHAHHRHRRFGRDAVDVAAQVDVEHRIAEDRDARPRSGRGLDECLQARASDQVFRHGGKDA